MIIRKVRLEPFGKFPQLICDFKPGLNVVLGSNEAGKTTLINAIHAALFISPNVRKNTQDWKDVISQYMPHPHGDTIRVVLEITDEKGDTPVKLCRAWGAEKEARLILDGGVEISDEISVNSRLEKLLRHGRGTYENVFIARQAELVNTLDRIKQDEKALSTLADMLRVVVFQSGGISVDELGAKIRERLGRLTNNWNSESNGPRAGRDIDNPHQQNVGRILEQYYKVRLLQQGLREAIEAEKAYEKSVQRVWETEDSYIKTEDREKEMEKVESDVNRRNALEPKLESLKFRQKQLKSIAQEWPKKEERTKILSEKADKLKTERKKLAEELIQSQKERELKKKRDIYSVSKELKEELNKTTETLCKMPPVTLEKMQELETKEKELFRLRAEVEGMKLKIKMTADEAIEIKVMSGFKEEKTFCIKGNEAFEAHGRFSISAKGWGIDIQSGVKDVEALLERGKELKGEIDRELHVLKLSGMEQARENRKNAAELEGRIRVLRGRLKDALKGWDFNALKDELEKAAGKKAVRDIDTVKEEAMEKEFELKGLNNEIDMLKEQCNDWRHEYTDHESLLEIMVELMSDAKTIKEELDRLAPIPKGYRDAEDFLNALKKVRQEKEVLREKLINCRENRIRAENNMPDESPEEIEKAFKTAGKRLSALKEEAAILQTVEEEFNRLKTELDAGTFYPLQKLFIEYLSPLTGHRYRHARMREALPECVAISDKAEPLPLRLLSYGTISGVALALRLAMAGYLFRENEGFIVMDDPLTDLDPERKKEAAMVLKKAAEGRQIIVTTFEPDTAELLGGNILRI